MTAIQLHDAVPVDTPLGPGYAIIFEGETNDNYWTVALESRAIVTFRQEEILICRSYTHGRGVSHERMRDTIARATK